MTVVIAVSPAPPTPELLRELTSACTDAVRPRRCAVVPDAAPDVLVEWSAEHSARVEATSDPPVTRVLTFREEDPAVDRWRSLGLVAAALVNDATVKAESTAPPPAPPPRLATFWLEGGVLFGSGIERGQASFGGTLRGGYQLPVVPMFVAASASYAAAGRGPNDVSPSWTLLTAGVGTVVALPDVALRPRLDLVLAQLVAEAPDGPRGGTSDSRRVGGGGAGIELAWPSTHRFSVVLGAEGAFLSGGTSIRQGAARVSAFPALEYRFFLGLEAAVVR